MNWQEFFAMGGYAPYIWTSYGLMIVVLVWNLIGPIRRRGQMEENLKRRFAQSGKKS